MSLASVEVSSRGIKEAEPKREQSRRDFSQEYRLTSRSLPEICEMVKHVVARIGMSKRIRFRGRRLTNEAFINAAALYLSEMDRDQQEAILMAYVARIEAMMSKPEVPPALSIMVE